MDAKLDLIVILDKSSSIGADNFQHVRSFSKKLVDILPLSPTNSQISLITYNSVIENVFTLGESSDKILLKQTIDDIEYKGKGTYTGKALQFTNKNTVSGRNPNLRLDNENVKTMILLVTDGRSRDEDVVISTAAKLQQKVKDIFVVGVGDNVRQSELLKIATSPDHVKNIADYNSLMSIVSWLFKNDNCDRTCPWFCNDVVNFFFAWDIDLCILKNRFENFVTNF